MSELNTTRYRFGTVNLTAGTFTLIIQFDADGVIRVIDGGVYEDTSATWEAETWYEVKMVTDGANVKYYIDDVEIYSGDQIAMEDVQQIRFVHDNAGGYAYIDNLKTVEGPLSTDSQSLEQLVVYPTPAVDVINIKTPASMEINEVLLFDLQGRNTGAIFSNGTVNVSGLSKGVYMLTIKTSEGTLTQKVVKK